MRLYGTLALILSTTPVRGWTNTINQRPCYCCHHHHGSILPQQPFRVAPFRRSMMMPQQQQQQVVVLRLANIYDDWRSDAVVVDALPLDEDNIRTCLEELIQSDYGQQMFGCHDLPASYGITGSLDFVEVEGPRVVLTLDGAFWHRRETVLGRAAVWLHARMPEITDVTVSDPSELDDFESVADGQSGGVLYVKDKRSDDFNGDRGTMEYQGIDPDVRGPFPRGIGGLRPGGSMIRPA